MIQRIPNPPPGFDDLSVDEQLDYVQALWDRIAAKPNEVPVPDWHREIIEKRLADYNKNPQEGKPWEVVRREIEKKLRDCAK